LIVAGYAATLWCYAAMGAAWRIGIDQKGTSKLVQSGPYRLIRHPIYGFQMTMLIGAALLLPTWISLAILVIHYVCASIKAVDEERHLTGVFGEEYRDYMKRTGRFLPGRG
jgi:protein-S-isoprenylcysteine O-methyltransferase Ste14